GAAVLSRYTNPRVLSILFGLTLLFSLIPILARIGEELPKDVRNDFLAAKLRLNGSYYDHRLEREVEYQVTGIPAAFGVMGVAGIVSGLLGIGAGVVKVLAHEICMKVPTKVSSATSNFMIGVTAASAAGVYLRRGVVLPYLVVPVAAAVLLGAFLGTKLMERMSNARIRQVFAVMLGVIGVQMLLRGLGKGS
ncbi:MAG TPA: sulfite exporter TauE/SafE family protein, partial [Elusimicrobiota bacterium]|nr:sulfite exporter TauE/SafE family protein [Elusimicrobiota bacterium]